LVAGGINHYGFHSPIYEHKRGSSVQVVSFYYFIAGLFEFAGDGWLNFCRWAIGFEQQDEVRGHFFLLNRGLLSTTRLPRQGRAVLHGLTICYRGD